MFFWTPKSSVYASCALLRSVVKEIAGLGANSLCRLVVFLLPLGRDGALRQLVWFWTSHARDTFLGTLSCVEVSSLQQAKVDATPS